MASSLFTWLVQNAAASTVIMACGARMTFWRQPADGVRVVQWSLGATLAAVVVAAWPTASIVSLGLLDGYPTPGAAASAREHSRRRLEKCDARRDVHSRRRVAIGTAPSDRHTATDQVLRTLESTTWRERVISRRCSVSRWRRRDARTMGIRTGELATTPPTLSAGVGFGRARVCDDLPARAAPCCW